jgi:Fuc2NAc and GlcNAc transferase
LIVALAVSAVVSFGVAIVTTWLVAKNAWRLGMIDMPNARSSHTTAIPRGGGFGIAAGVAAGMLLLAAFGREPGRELVYLLAGAAAIATLGAVDDMRPLRARYRLLVQLLIAIVVVAGMGTIDRLPLPPPLDVSVGWLAGPLTVVWLVGVTNFYNFMDGIDGLAAGQAVASCIGVAVAAWSVGSVYFALMLSASAMGFLVLNRPPAKVFLGDTGSTSFGFAIACLPLLAPAALRPLAVLAVAIGLSLFLIDPLETLVRLARAGHRFGAAHRSHSYQRLAWNRGRHAAVAGSLVAVGLVLAIAGGLAYRVAWAAWPAALLALGAFALERYLAGRSGLAKLAEDASRPR